MLRAKPDFFNWTWTHRLDGDLVAPHGWIHPLSREEAVDPRLDDVRELLSEGRWLRFDRARFLRTLPRNRSGDFLGLARRGHKVAWIVSHCYTRSRRHMYAMELQRHIEVNVYGRCGRE